MDESRKELVENNIKLVYYLIHKHYPTYSRDEDLAQVGMIGLCKAANRWDSSKASFSTYASRIILNEIREEFRRRKRAVNTVSLYSTLGSDETECTFVDVLPGDDDIDYFSLDEFLDTLSDEKDKETVDILAYGGTCEDVSKKLGCSKQTVNGRLRRLKRTWEDEYGSFD